MTQKEIITVLLILTVVLIMLGVWWHDHKREKKEGSVSSGIIGTFDLVFHPEAAQASEIREVQKELPAEAANPGDPLFPGDKIEIEVSKAESLTKPSDQ